MKLHRTLLAVLVSACFLSSGARAQEKTFELEYLSAMLLYCMPPTVARADVANFAASKGLQEYPVEKARLLDKTGGRAFQIPSNLGNAVLAAHKPASCSILARRLDVDRFWVEADRFFGTKSPFKIISDKSTAEEHHRNYSGDFSGETVLMLSTRNNPAPDGVQAVITFSRIK